MHLCTPFSVTVVESVSRSWESLLVRGRAVACTLKEKCTTFSDFPFLPLTSKDSQVWPLRFFLLYLPLSLGTHSASSLFLWHANDVFVSGLFLQIPAWLMISSLRILLTVPFLVDSTPPPAPHLFKLQNTLPNDSPLRVSYSRRILHSIYHLSMHTIYLSILSI